VVYPSAGLMVHRREVITLPMLRRSVAAFLDTFYCFTVYGTVEGKKERGIPPRSGLTLTASSTGLD